LDAPIQTDKTEPRIEKLSLRGILAYALENGASDIHLKVARPPAIRIEGVLRFTEIRELAEIDMMRFLDEIMSPLQKQYFLETGDADFAASVPALGRFRVNCYRQRGTTAMVFRYVKADIWDFRTLNLPERAMERIASLDRGLVLVTGTTSSGKSTTLAALIDRINATRQSHILTLEDPIEYLHADKKCSVSQREVSIDTKDFKTGLRAIMREDPNVILIGEMRDFTTLRAGLKAAETGHLVFATLHSTDAYQTITRILDLTPQEERHMIRQALVGNLRAVLSQRLLPTIRSDVPRVPAVEILLVNASARKLIAEGREVDLPTVIKSSYGDGMVDFNESLRILVDTEFIDLKTAYAYTNNPDELKMVLKGIRTGSSGILG